MDKRGNEYFVIPYDKCALPLFAHVLVGIAGYAAGFVVLWLFYQVLPLAIIGSVFMIPVAIGLNISSSKKRRLDKLLGQFQSLLESLVVSLQAGGTDLGSLESAIEDLSLMYSDKADIVKEIRLIVQKFNNHLSIGDAFMDFALRSGLEDVKLFAAVYKSVEGKGEKTRDIVIRTQKILSDKIEIQAEIKTLSSGAVMEINIIILIPLLIVAVMGYMGGELMQGLFSPVGHAVATLALGIFAAAYVLGKKIANIKV